MVNNLNDDIDLRDLLANLFKSRKTIILTSVIFSLLAASYSYLTPKPMPIFESTANIVVGSVNNKILDNSELVTNIKFYFQESQSVEAIGRKFVKIKLRSPSKEKNLKELNDLIDFAINDSQEKIDLQKQAYRIELSKMQSSISNHKSSLDSIPSDIDINTNSELFLFTEKLKFNLKKLENDALLAKNILNDKSLYSNTSNYGEINSIQINSSKDKTAINILFGFIVGLLLSIFALTFRYAFFKK